MGEIAAGADRNGYDIRPADGGGKAQKHPVHLLSRYEAVKWANARSEKEGLMPCYFTYATPGRSTAPGGSTSPRGA